MPRAHQPPFSFHKIGLPPVLARPTLTAIYSPFPLYISIGYQTILPLPPSNISGLMKHRVGAARCVARHRRATPSSPRMLRKSGKAETRTGTSFHAA